MEKGKKLRIDPPPEKLTITRFSKELFAFTLAEVLITLGIIGVVAAITIPNVVAKFQHKALESQFKKSVSVISQVVLKAKNDIGADKFTDYCTKYNFTNSKYERASECYNSLYNNYIKLKNNYNYTTTSRDEQRKDTIKTYNGKQTFTHSSTSSALGDTVLFITAMPDGSYVNFQINEYSLYIGVDINGGKKPNKLGHDIFIFTLNKQNDFLTSLGEPKNYTDEEIANGNYDDANRAGNPCNLTSNQQGNGIGCAYYALKNICPYDSSKTYFECLP